MNDRAGQPRRIAYLNTQYPSLSHTFIEREVEAVRANGIDVHTFSVRKPGAADLLSEAHRAAAAETTYLIDGAGPFILALLAYGLAHPIATIRGLLASQQLSPPGLRNRLLHLVYFAEAIRLVRGMQQQNLDHVHVHMAINCASVAWIATNVAPEIGYSLTIHGSLEFFNMQFHRLREKTRSAAFVRCISDFCRGQVMIASDQDVWERFSIVHCGIDPDQFTPPATPRPTEGPLRLLTVGRFAPVKGYPMLLEACRQLEDRGIDWQLEMIGGGEMLKTVRDLVKTHGLEHRVSLPGPVGQDEIVSHFHAADVMVISSFMEGIPVVLMEAMACEMAVLSTNVAGIPELVTDGVEGVLVRAGSVDDLAAGLLRLAEQRDQLSAMGRAGRARVMSEFAIDDVGRRMAALFRANLTSTAR